MQGLQVRVPTPQEIAADAQRRGAPPGPPPTLGLTARAADPMDQAVAEGQRGLNVPPPGMKDVTFRSGAVDPQLAVDLERAATRKALGVRDNVLQFESGDRGGLKLNGPAQVVREGVPIAGSIVGGILGGRAGGWKGSAVGSGVGASAGEGLAMIGESVLGAPPSREEVVQRLETAAPTAILSDAAGGVVGAGVGKILRPFRNKVGQIGLEAAEFLEGKLTPAQMADSHALSVIENLVEGSIFGGGRYRNFLAEQQALLRRKADEIINQFGERTSIEEAGKTVNAAVAKEAAGAQAGRTAAADQARATAAAAQQGAESKASELRARFGNALGVERTGQLWQALQDEAHDAAKRSASALYDTVDELSKGVRVSLAPLAEFVEQEVARRGQLGTELRGGKLASTLKKVGEATEEVDPVEVLGGNETARAAIGGMDPGDPRIALLLNALSESGVSSLNEGVTFRQAHEIRSALGKMAATADRTGDGSLRGVATQLQKRIDDAMTAAADDEVAGVPGLRETYDRATAAWKDMYRTYESGLLAQVSEKEPRAVVHALIQPGRVEDIRAAKKALPPEAWKAVQAEHLASLLRGKQGDWATGDQLLSRLTKLTPETLDAVYGAQGRLDLETVGAGLQRAGLAGKEAEKLAREAAQDPAALPPPYQVVARIIKPGSVEGVERMRRLVGDEQWKKVQSAHVQELLKGEKPGELVSGAELQRRLHKLGKPTIDAAYPRGTADGIFQLARVLDYVNRERSGTGKMYIQLAQAGAGANVVFQPTSKAAKVAGATLLTPWMLGRIITSPTGRKWLTTGLGPSAAKTEAGAKALTNLVGFLVREGMLTEQGPPSAPTLVAPGGRQGGPGSAGAANAPPRRPGG